MSRIALISDIHGNCIALAAVLEDIVQLGGVDEYWFLDDYVALGPDPVERVSKLATGLLYWKPRLGTVA